MIRSCKFRKAQAGLVVLVLILALPAIVFAQLKFKESCAPTYLVGCGIL